MGGGEGGLRWDRARKIEIVLKRKWETGIDGKSLQKDFLGDGRKYRWAVVGRLLPSAVCRPLSSRDTSDSHPPARPGPYRDHTYNYVLRSILIHR